MCSFLGVRYEPERSPAHTAYIVGHAPASAVPGTEIVAAGARDPPGGLRHGHGGVRTALGPGPDAAGYSLPLRPVSRLESCEGVGDLVENCVKHFWFVIHRDIVP